MSKRTEIVDKQGGIVSNDDTILAERIKNGDEAACTELWNKYFSKIVNQINYKIHNRQDAEDIAVHAFEKIFTNIHTYTPTYKLVTWMYRITNNTLIDYFRANKNRALPNASSLDEFKYSDGDDSISYADDLEGEMNNPEEAIIIQEESDFLWDNIDKVLSKQDALVIRLRFFDGLPFKEIVKKTGINDNTVRGITLRATVKLSNYFKNTSFLLKM